MLRDVCVRQYDKNGAYLTLWLGLGIKKYFWVLGTKYTFIHPSSITAGGWNPQPIAADIGQKAHIDTNNHTHIHHIGLHHTYEQFRVSN